MFGGDTVHAPGHPQRQDRHLEVLILGTRLSQGHELFARESHRIPERARDLFDFTEREHVVTGRHGRMRRKQARGADLLLRLDWGEPRLDELAQALDVTEGGMALVRVPELGLEAQRTQHAY